MHRLTRLGCLTLALFAVSACGGRAPAPRMPNGAKVEVMVWLDRSTAPEMPAEKVEQVHQVANWMEPDLVDLMRRAGYDSRPVPSPDTPTALGQYLLRVKITEYNAGSKAARMFVGWGAGAARLDTSFELIGPAAAVYTAGAPGNSTGRADWQRVARKVNEEIVMAVDMRLRKGL